MKYLFKNKYSKTIWLEISDQEKLIPACVSKSHTVSQGTRDLDLFILVEYETILVHPDSHRWSIVVAILLKPLKHVQLKISIIIYMLPAICSSPAVHVCRYHTRSGHLSTKTHISVSTVAVSVNLLWAGECDISMNSTSKCLRR